MEGKDGLKCEELCFSEKFYGFLCEFFGVFRYFGGKSWFEVSKTLGSLVVESSAILLHSVVGHFYI